MLTTGAATASFFLLRLATTAEPLLLPLLAMVMAVAVIAGGVKSIETEVEAEEDAAHDAGDMGAIDAAPASPLPL